MTSPPSRAPAPGSTELLTEGPIEAVFHHCAVAAPRIRDLLPLYREVLGGRICTGGDNMRVGYRALQLEYPNGSVIELMEPLAGSAFFDSFFRRGGGLHHVTFKVMDLLAAVEVLEAKGIALTGLYLDNPEWKEVFVHPREASGVLVQLAQAAPGYPPVVPDLTIEQVLAGQGSAAGEGNGIPSP